MGFFRWMIGLPLAAGVTLILLLMMSGLIGQTPLLLPAKPPLDIYVTPQIDPTPPDKVTPVRPVIKGEPPPPDIFRGDPKTLPDQIPGPPLPGPRGGDPVGPSPGSITPTIRIAPPYPEACASKGIEGDVLVRFDVTPEGTVTNVEILSAPDRCFERGVIKAVSGWKYPPDYRDGRAVMRRGVTERFVFTLTDQ